jgi:predicted nucleic acid-binding Zn ribbon protein
MAAPRKCVVCKTEYEYCPHCGKNDPSKMWMVTFCSENCREILRICSNYRHKKMTKAQAKKALNKCELSEPNMYAKTIASALEEIL